MIQLMELAERLKKKMGDAKMSQYALAKKSGVPQPTIHRILVRESREPRRSTLDKLATALSANPDWLATGSGVEDAGMPPIIEVDEWSALSIKRRNFIERVAMSELTDSFIDVLTAMVGTAEGSQPENKNEAPKVDKKKEAPKMPDRAISYGPPSVNRINPSIKRKKTS